MCRGDHQRQRQQDTPLWSLVNTGPLTFSGGYLELQNDATISNLNTGTFDLTTDCDISYYSGSSGPIYNAGLFRKSGGSGISTVGAEFHNAGTIEVQTGTLRLSRGGHYHGALLVRSNGVLSVFGGTHEFAPGSVITCEGTVECGGAAVLDLGADVTLETLAITGGRLTGAGTVSTRGLSWEKGTIECTVRCAGGRILSQDADTPTLRGGQIINSGWLAGGLIATEDGAMITNLASGVMEFTNSPAGIRHDAGAYGAFYNAGQVRAGPQATMCSIGEPFYNTGRVESQGKGCRFKRAFVQSAGLSCAGEGPIVAEQGFDLLGGELVGTNVVRGNVTNSSVVSPGASYGRLTIEGTYVQQANGRLHIELGGPLPGTQHDQLVVTGGARLAGTLEVVLPGDFVPGPGVVITALVCNVRNGTFTTAVKPAEYYVLYIPGSVLLETENAPPLVNLEVRPEQLACRPFEVRGSAVDADGAVTNLAFLIEGVAVEQFPRQSTGKTLVCVDFPGQIQCTVQAMDDKGAIGETNVTVTIGTLPVHVLDPVGFQTNRAFKLCMAGQPGSNYAIEAVTDLQTTNWVVLGTMENTNGIWRFSDTTATNAAWRYYRARQF